MTSVWIKTNDIFDELSEENKRLSKELMFANKCLKILVEFKLNFDFYSNKIKSVFIFDEWKKFEELSDQIKKAFDERSLHKEDNANANTFMSNHLDESNASEDYSPPNSVRSDDSDIKPIIKTKKVSNKKPNRVSNKEAKRLTADGERTIIRRPNRKKQSLNCTWPGCDYIAKQPDRLRAHVNDHQGLRPYSCDFEGCGKAFTNKAYLRGHLKLHTDKELTYRFICQYEGCGRKFQKRYDFREHENRHLRKYEYECPHCTNKRFITQKLLRVHIRMKHELLDEPLICTENDCNRKFKTALSFQTHQKIMHSKSKKEFVCDQPGCEYKTAMKQSLDRHKQSVHTSDRPFKCPVPGCNSAFIINSYMREHVRRCHLAGRDQQCSYDGCKKAFKTKSELSKHVKATHMGIRYQCDWPGCENTAVTPGALKTHKLFVHLGDRNFKCQWPECGKAFKSKSALNDHIRVHNNDKKFACTWPGCSYRCCNSSNLNKHLKVHNK